MRALVIWLRDMYEGGRIDEARVDALLGAGRIDADEADYIKGGL